MTNYSIRAFADELEKIAAPRAVKEWQAATARGDEVTADAIAKAYGDIQAKPRYLKDVSRGGYEAGVDLMMGRAKEELPGGYAIRKLYKHDSPLHGGDTTRKVLELKKMVTDQAREMPGAKVHVPAMAGFEQHGERDIRSPKYRPRFTSHHEYVPKMQTLQQHPDLWQEVTGILDKKLLSPLKNKGVGMDDVVTLGQDFSLRPQVRYNPGNIALVGDRERGFVPKVIDFLPTDGHSNPARAYQYRHERSGKAIIDPDARSVDELRKDVFKDQSGSREAKKVRVGPARSLPHVSQPVPQTSTMRRYLRRVPKPALAALPAAVAVGAGLWYHQKRQQEQQEQEEQQKAASRDELRKVAGPIGRERMLYGALGGAALGGVTGAVVDHGSRGRGALIGALGGGALGTGAGALYHKLNPIKMGKPSYLSQALDNKSDDPFFHGMGKKPLSGELSPYGGAKEHSDLRGAVNDVVLGGKKVYQDRKNNPHTIVHRNGPDVVVDIMSQVKDNAGRHAPAVILFPGGGDQETAKLIAAARRFAKRVEPDRWPDG